MGVVVTEKNIVTYNGFSGQYSLQQDASSGEPTASDNFFVLLAVIPPTLLTTVKAVKQFYGNKIYTVNMRIYNQTGGTSAEKYAKASKEIGTYA